MTPEESIAAVEQRQRVRLRLAHGVGTYAEGSVIAYSIVPTVTILTDSGEKISWRHDLVEAVPE